MKPEPNESGSEIAWKIPYLKPCQRSYLSVYQYAEYWGSTS